MYVLLFHSLLHMLDFFLFLESIAHDFGLNDSHRQPNSDLAQLAENYTDDLKVLSLKTHLGQFLMKFILFCIISYPSDNLTEKRIVKNSSSTALILSKLIFYMKLKYNYDSALD